MTNFSVKDFVLFAGLGALAYWLFKKPKTNAINLNLDTKSSNFGGGRKTIYLNLNGDRVVKDFDYSEGSTFAPSRTTIDTFNDL
jgi:hypothetical protein